MKKWIKWSVIRLVLISFVVIGLFSFAKSRNVAKGIGSTQVKFVGQDVLFLNEETVNKLLIENNQSASTFNKSTIDLNNLERKVEQHQMVDKAEVYLTVEGVLKVDVVQKNPIVRVLGKQGSYYIDYKGTTMPTSELFTARVPIVYGDIPKEYIDDMKVLFQTIYDDAFLHKNITSIRVLPSGSVVMKNRNFNYDIEFGRPIRIKEKILNYKAFFYKAVQDSSIQNYKKVNLRFNSQVVCS